MRFDTHRVSAHLVNELQKGRPRLEVTDDGGDLIHVSMDRGETALIYLIENPITIYEIRNIVQANTAVGTYSLFILRRDLLLPGNGVRYRPDDWMAVLLALHSEKIYAYDAYYGAEFYIFPVYFLGLGAERLIQHGQSIDATRLTGETIRIISMPLIAGIWRMATFEPRGEQAAPRVESALSVYYRQLGLRDMAGRASVKRAYRRLARKYHPDVDADPGATARMQQINEAYQRIMEALDERDSAD